MTKIPDSNALMVLRTLFDLAEVDVGPTPQLVAGLLGLPVTTVDAQIAYLRGRGLVARDRLTMTMVGLAVATALAPVEPRPMGARMVVVRAA